MIAFSAKLCDTERLFQRLEATEASHAIERGVKRMERSVVSHGGRLVSVAGGELLATFGSAEDACQAAIDMQVRVSTLPPVSGLKLPVRIGMQCVAPFGADDASEAPALLIAARIADLAENDQILATSALIEKLPGQSSIVARHKGNIGRIEYGEARLDLVAIDWRKHDPDDAPATNQAAPAHDGLAVHYRGKNFLIDARSPCLTIGRDASNQLVIADRQASRAHGLIERRKDSYFYVDRSTNGSHVRVAGQAGIMVRRQEIELTGSGRIYFGGAASNPKTDFVEFTNS